MKAYTVHAEAHLFERNELLRDQPHESWRGLHLHFSREKPKGNPELFQNFILKPLLSLVSTMTGYVFVCQNGDIMLLFQGKPETILQKLASHFGDMYQEDTTQRIYNLYDLSTELDAWCEHGEGLYLRWLAAQEEQRYHYTWQGPMPRHHEQLRSS